MSEDVVKFFSFADIESECIPFLYILLERKEEEETVKQCTRVLLSRLHREYLLAQKYKELLVILHEIKKAFSRNRVAVPPGVYLMFSRVYQELGLYSKAYQYVRKAHLTASPDDFQTIASVYFNIARIRYLQERYRDAARYWEKSLEFYRKAGNKKQERSVILNLTIVYEDLKAHDKAIYYKNLLAQSSLSREQRMFECLNEGYELINKERWEDAVDLLYKAYRYARALSNREVIMRAALEIGKYWMYRKNFSRALRWMNIAVDTFSQIIFPMPFPEILEAFAREKPVLFPWAIRAALGANRFDDAFFFASYGKAFSLTNSLFAHHKEEGIVDENLLDKVKRVLSSVSRKATIVKREDVIFEIMRRNHLRNIYSREHLRSPARGEMFINFFNLDGAIVGLWKRSSECGIETLSKRKVRQIKEALKTIENEVLCYRDLAEIEEPVETIRQIIRKTFPLEGVKKISVSPALFLFYVPWSLVFPDIEVEITPTFFRRKVAKPKYEFPILAMLCVDDLVYAKKEWERLKRLFPGGIFLRGKRASLENFVKYAPRARVLHIISHTVYEGAGFKSAIQMGDGSYLSGYEIAIMKLRCELASLAICASSSGNVFPLSGDIESLTSAFLLAGARYTVGSITPIEDSAAATFFSTFYSSHGSWSKRFFQAFQKCLKMDFPVHFFGFLGLYRNLW